MTIIFKIDDLLLDLFPRTKESNIDHNVLMDELSDFYSVGPNRPKIDIEDDTVTVEIDTDLIETQEQDYRKVVALCEKGQYTEAKKLLRSLLDKAPHVSEYHRILGQIYFDERNYDDALDRLIDALRWDPKNIHAYIIMGNVYIEHKDDTLTAMKYFDRAMEIDPDDVVAMDNMGVVLMKQGQTDKAEQYFEKVYKSDPDYPNTHYAIALLADLKDDCVTAFKYAVSAMKKSQETDDMYKQAASLAFESAKKVMRNNESDTIIEKYLSELKSRSGKSIKLMPDDSLASAARLELAENYDRDEHVVKYKPNNPAVNHLIMHELVHLEYIVQAREVGKNELFISNKGHW